MCAVKRYAVLIGAQFDMVAKTGAQPGDGGLAAGGGQGHRDAEFAQAPAQGRFYFRVPLDHDLVNQPQRKALKSAIGEINAQRALIEPQDRSRGADNDRHVTHGRTIL